MLNFIERYVHFRHHLAQLHAELGSFAWHFDEG